MREKKATVEMMEHINTYIYICSTRFGSTYTKTNITSGTKQIKA